MADVRALLKAKRQQARINHPYAAYGGANGSALRCTACGVAVKAASAWEGHLVSKSHRGAVAKLKAREEESARHVLSKRKAEEPDGDGGGDGGDDDDDDGQMQVEVEGGTEVEVSRKGKRQRTEEREVPVQGRAHGHPSREFPTDFFSDPSRAAPPRDDGEDGEDEMDQDRDQERERGETSTTRTKTDKAPKSQFDMEWEAFERDMQSVSHPRQQRPRAVLGADGGAEATGDDPQVAYARATIAAEPELVPSLVGLPGTQGDGGEAGGGAGAGGQGAEADAGGRKAVGISEEEERKRKEMDERELIMDRLVEEERAQEDAYNRVALLRNKVQMLKQKRQLAKAKGNKADDTQA